MIKLKDLALELGLSQTTVSRALNGYPEVNEQTRIRVADAALRHGYRPNDSARRLATGRCNAVGVVVEPAGELHISELLIGMGSRFSREEIDIVITPLEPNPDQTQAYRRLAASRKVDAVVLHSPVPDDPRIPLLESLRMPFVVHGRSEGAPPHAWLDIDNRQAFYDATAHLLALGHRRIATINGPRELTFAQHRDAGYSDAHAAQGLVADPGLMRHCIFTDENGFRFASELLQASPRPTAFLAGSMMTALGIIRAVRAQGLVVGRDVSLIAHDDGFPYLNADAMVPRLTTTHSPVRLAGKRIAELMLKRLAGVPVGQLQELWPVELVVRESTLPPPA